MLFRRAVLIPVLAVVALLSTGVSYAGSLSEADRKRDSRLEKPVSLLTPRIYYLGELLEELSRQTGVVLTAGDKDEAAGELVMVRVPKAPLADVMNALWSLVSYQHAAWDWDLVPENTSGSTPTGRVAYRLVRPRAAQLLGAKLRHQVQQDFETEAMNALDNLGKTSEELKELEKKGKTPEYIGRKRTLSNQEGFAETFPSLETRLRLLRDNEPVKVPVEQLGERAQAYVQSEMAFKRGLDPTLKFPEPTHVQFGRKEFPGNITPSLVVLIGDGRSMEGYSCFGGTPTEKRWRQTMAAEWLLDGDAAEDPALETRVTVPEKGSAVKVPSGFMVGPESRLWQIAEGASLPFMVRLPSSDTSDRGSPYTLTVRAALKKIDPLQTKWRNRIMLVSDPSWFVKETEQDRVPWSVVKKLREAEVADNDGLLPLAALANAAHDLRAEQLQRLTGEFPVMSHVATWQNWFVQMARTPNLIQRLQTPGGVPIQKMSVLTTAKLPTNVSADQVAAVRLTVANSAGQGEQPARRTINFIMLGADKKPLAYSGFSYESRKQRVPPSETPPAGQ